MSNKRFRTEFREQPCGDLGAGGPLGELVQDVDRGGAQPGRLARLAAPPQHSHRRRAQLVPVGPGPARVNRGRQQRKQLPEQLGCALLVLRRVLRRTVRRSARRRSALALHPTSLSAAGHAVTDSPSTAGSAPGRPTPLACLPRQQAAELPVDHCQRIGSVRAARPPETRRCSISQTKKLLLFCTKQQQLTKIK